MSERLARPPVLLLHGQPGGAEDFQHVIAALGDRATPLAIDRPGWGGRTRATGLAGNARAALAALDAAGIERAVVVGHSFGGAVACWLAVHHAERVSSLILAAPAANQASLYRVDRLLAKPLFGDLAGAAALSTIGLALTLGPIRERLGREIGLDHVYLRQLARRISTPAGWLAFTSEQRTLVRELPGLEGRLGEITAPTTIVAGRRDRVVPLPALRKLAEQIPGSELLLVDHGDHLLPLRRAAEFAEIIVSSVSGA